MLTIFNVAGIKVGVANFCAAMDTLIDQDGILEFKLMKLWGNSS